MEPAREAEWGSEVLKGDEGLRAEWKRACKSRIFWIKGSEDKVSHCLKPSSLFPPTLGVVT